MGHSDVGNPPGVCHDPMSVPTFHLNASLPMELGHFSVKETGGGHRTAPNTGQISSRLTSHFQGLSSTAMKLFANMKRLENMGRT